MDIKPLYADYIPELCVHETICPSSFFFSPTENDVIRFSSCALKANYSILRGGFNTLVYWCIGVYVYVMKENVSQFYRVLAA